MKQLQQCLAPKRDNVNNPAPLKPTQTATRGEVVNGIFDDLLALFVNAHPINMSHWNPRSGAVFVAPTGEKRGKAVADFEQRLFDDADWIEVPFVESDTAHELAVKWCETLAAGKGKAAVKAALLGPKPFRALRAALKSAPGLARRYQRAMEEEAAIRLVEFCLSQDWRLNDPRFDAIAQRITDLDDQIVVVTQTPVPARLVLSTLSIGRRTKAVEP